MGLFIPREEFEAALPTHSATGMPMWVLDVEEDEGTLLNLVYSIPIVIGSEISTKRVLVSCTDYAPDGIDMQGLEICAQYFYKSKGEWRLWRRYDPKDEMLQPKLDIWDVWIVNAIRWLYKLAYEDEAKWYNASTPKSSVQRKPVQVKRTPPKQPNAPVTGDSIPVEAHVVETGEAVPASIDLGLKLKFTPSAFQLKIWNYIKTDKRNLVVEALAGSGKTTTIVEALRLVPQFLNVAFVAFNKRIADTLSKKAPSWVHVSTLHSLGLSNMTKAYGIKNVRNYIDAHKVLNIVQGIETAVRETDETQADAIRKLKFTVRDIVSLLKATLSQPDAASILYLSDRYGIELNGDFDLLVRLVTQTFDKSIELMDRTIDYDDMIYASATGMVACRKFDVLFVDECQDLNACQIAMVLKSAKRIVAVGDRHQSIYGFRGADTEAVPRLIRELDAGVLPLSITYRMPRSHVEYVRSRLPHIPLEAAEGAIEGAIGDKSVDDLVKEARTGDLVLCRCNAPLVGPAFALIRKGKKAVILGRDIGEGLEIFMDKVAEKSGKTALLDILHEMSIYVANETAKLIDAGKTNLSQLMQDKHETIIALADGCMTMADVKAKIKQVFSNEEQGVVFSSVHKAKGSEAERVYILKPDLMPHPNASQEWEMEQEWNIWYVAHSRSKNEMYFVPMA